MQNTPSFEEVENYLRLVVEPGEVVEQRILNCVDNPKYPAFTVAGWFDRDHLDALAKAAQEWTSKADGCYVTINPVDPALLARAANRVVPRPKHATADTDIVRRVGLVIDADPVRPAGISATEAEKALAWEKINELVADLTERGWPAPILSDSGNGFHARFKINLPSNDGGLVERVLKAADALYSDEYVKIDTALSNPSRIIKLPGTMARKGDSTATRPHRWSRVLSVPEPWEVMPRALLEKLAALAPALPEPGRKATVKPTSAHSATDKEVRDNDAWVGNHVADDYAARTSWGALLKPHEWMVAATLPSGEIRWTRPGKGGGTSATTGHDGHDVFKVFSDSAPPFAANGCYSKFQAYALINHNGDESAAAKALYAVGFGARQPSKNSQRTTASEGGREPTESGSKGKRPAAAESLLTLASEVGLFNAPDGRGYAEVPVSGHVETQAVRSAGFRRWLYRAFYLDQGRAPSGEALRDALGVLEARALFDGPRREVFVRIGADADRSTFYLDLADQAWRVVEITPAGWRVLDRSPVPFRRAAGVLALPNPTRGGSIETLRKYLNLPDDDAWRLVVAWLLATLRPFGPYPVLVVLGEQGSAKTTTCRIMRGSVDPNATPLRSSPRDERDLMIAANASWVVALDNLDSLNPWLSDALCRLATGGGFSTRQLYSDDEECLFTAMRPLLLNGIDEVAARPDLLDRSIVLKLPPIPDEARREEKTLWSELEADRGAILGAMIDAVSKAISLLPTVHPERLPRMADFARWGEAVGQALGWGESAFLDTYRRNIGNVTEAAAEGSAVAGAVRDYMAERPEWEGLPADLLRELTTSVGETVSRSRWWPTKPNRRWCLTVAEQGKSLVCMALFPRAVPSDARTSEVSPCRRICPVSVA